MKYLTTVAILAILAGCGDEGSTIDDLPDARTPDTSDAAVDAAETVEVDGRELEPWAAELVREYDVEVVSSWPYDESETIPAEPPPAFDFEVERVRRTFTCSTGCEDDTGIITECTVWASADCGRPCPLNLDRCTELRPQLANLFIGYECEFNVAGWQAVDPANDSDVFEFYDEIESNICFYE